MTPRRGVLIVFAKAPHPGRVKTRMSPPLSLEQAAELYGCMLDDVLTASVELAGGLDLEPVLAVHPVEAMMEMAARVPCEYRIVGQRGRDLSERMSWAASEAAAAGAGRILLRGSDSPALDADTLAAVVDRLGDGACDVVACPDADGGYSLIGMRRFRDGLFGHAMSTASVLEDTLANAERLGLSATTVGQSFDLDTGDDLLRLADAHKEGGTTLCPRTIAYLDENALWPATG